MQQKGRSILAYYARREEAEQAASRMRGEGFETVQLDQITSDPGEQTEQLHNPLTGEFNSLASLTIGASEETGDDMAVLLAADPSASGLATDGEYGPGSTDRSWLVTVVTTEDQVNRAVQILEESGGAV